MPENVTTNMMESYFNSDLSNSEETPFHLITTNHPYMATLGLSQFTTGTLYRWWNEKNANGEYVNHKYFAENTDEITNKTVPDLILLGKEDAREGFSDKTEGGINQFAFQAWRKEGDNGAGQYVTKYIDGGHTELWDFSQAGTNEAGDNRNYSYSDVNLEEYDDYFLEANTDGEMVKKSLFQMPDGKGKKEKVRFKGISPITNAVALNDYVNHNEYKSLTKADWDTTEFARSEFVLDIQAAKAQGGGMGYVEWSGYVPFFISLGSGDASDTFKCEKPDWVKFRLYLYPNSSPKSSRRGIAMAKPTFAGPPVDSLGRKYQYKEDGRFSAFPEGSQAAEVVGELDMTFNEYTGKWEAGSKQMVGIVTQTIPKAQVMKASTMRNLPPEEMLKNPSDPNSHIIFGSGAAMPLNMQNGNPMQWTPNYAQASDTDADGKFTVQCPTKTDDKATFRVFNASAKSLATDQMVLLNQIDGLWFAIDFPSGIESDTVVAGAGGEWEFQYTATNIVNFFRDSLGNRIDSGDVEKGFHFKYYKSLGNSVHPDNSGIYVKDLTYKRSDGTSFIWDMSYMMGGGFHQFSSFDYMDNLIGGTRADKNALGPTNPVIGPNGESLFEDLPDGFTTMGFFGCIFPDGYNSEDISQYRASRNFDVTPTIAVSGSDGLPTNSIATLHDDPYTYSVGFTRDTLPFDNGLQRHGPTQSPQVDGQFIPIFNDNDNAMTHLPADIALNAAPSGKYGQPLRNVHFIDEMYYGASPLSNSRYCFTHGQNWLYKRFDEGTAGVADHVANSAFDFRPKALNRVMFRPLKAEAYAEMWPGAYQFNETAGSRKEFGNSIASRMNPNARGASDTAQQREFNADLTFTTKYNPNSGPFEVAGMNGQICNLYNSFWGLQLNVDIPGDETTDYKISPNASFDAFDSSQRFNWQIFGENQSKSDWVHGKIGQPEGTFPPWRSSEQYSAGAVGIIGAVTTTFANSLVKFTTDNMIGCYNNRFIYFINGVANSDDTPAWGGNVNTYRSLHTTNLFAKIYHHWPRQQTIYDSRYFAVHHFNAGIMSEINSSATSLEDYYLVSTKNSEETQLDPETGSSKKYWYSCDVGVYDIDIRIPSAKVANPVEFDPAPLPTQQANRPVSLNRGSYIYATRAFDGVVYEYLTKDKWNISTLRRGKLLPFTYDLKSVIIPKVKVDLPEYLLGLEPVTLEEKIYSNGGYAITINPGVSPGSNDGFYGTIPIPFYDMNEGTSRTFDPFDGEEDVVMIVKNPGFNYKVGDTFSCSDKLGAGLIITVKGVTETTATGDDKVGRVTSFEVTETGYDFSYSGFTAVEPADPDKNINGKKINKTSSGISVFTASPQPTVDGEGFQLHLVRGEVGEFKFTDEKPALATANEANFLSIPANSDAGGNNYGIFGVETGTVDNEIEITNKSDTNKYDIFLFFHNDVSHTFMQHDQRGSVATGRLANIPDQFIDLTIGSE